MITNFVYVSPTDTTKNVLKIMFKELSCNMTIADYNLTNIQFSGIDITFPITDLVVFGIPVYSGRVPKVAIDRFRNIRGQNTPAILIATYGNRNYDDALLELNDMLIGQGFMIISAAAVVTEHSVVRQIAAGRPNQADMQELKNYAKTLMTLDMTKELPVTIKGNRPYRKYQSILFKPKGNKKCISCWICVNECPVGAITASNPRYTDKSTCISCMRCIKYCPKKARDLSKLEHFIAYRFIADKCKEKKTNEFFI